MNTEELKILMDKYLEGESTLKEERRLKELFLAGEIPEEYESMKVHFEYLQDASAERFSDDPFSKSFSEGASEKAPVIPLFGGRKKLMRVIGVAASILIIFGIVFQLNRYISSVEDHISDPKVAYNEAKRALLFVSSKLNSGTDKLQPIEKVNEGVNSLKQVSKFDDGIQQSQKAAKFNSLDKILVTTN